jgi:hypothetical protein
MARLDKAKGSEVRLANIELFQAADRAGKSGADGVWKSLAIGRVEMAANKATGADDGGLDGGWLVYTGLRS